MGPPERSVKPEETLHWKYHKLAKEISKVLYEIDPENIADLEDEYDPEAEDIAHRILLDGQPLSLEMIKEVFERWFNKTIHDDEDEESYNEILVKLKALMPAKG